MAELKYAKYIQTELVLPEEQQKGAVEYAKRATRILWLDDALIKGAPNIMSSWYWKTTDKEGEGTPAHVHDFDEVIILLGSDPDHPHDLCGEVEFWLEDEKYILKNSCYIFAPKGLRHCPLRVLKVDKPILFLAVSMSEKYYRTNI